MLTVIESCGGFTGMYCAIFPTFQYVGNYSCKTIKNSKCKLFQIILKSEHRNVD